MALKAGSSYGSLMYPHRVGGNPLLPLGAGYVDVMGVTEPKEPDMYDEYSIWQDKQRFSRDLQNERMQQGFSMMKNLFDEGPQIQERGGRTSMATPYVPKPNYIGAGPVWNQQQINAQSNLQRGNLLTQANNQSTQFNNNLANRGFSPLSPFGMLNEQNNLMRANAGAAANETNLNWTAAKGNSDAALQAAGINAKLYGDYANALGQSRNAQNDYDIRRQQLGLSRTQQKNDLMLAIMRGLV